jgi:hypothetical protein
MRVKWFVLTLLFLGCKEDQFPKGIYDYQVERLLSGGESKVWLLAEEKTEGIVTRPEVCSDSTRLLIAATQLDSIEISRLVPKVDCSGFDTLALGNANTSGELVFTDSLIFSTGEFWIVESISSLNLILSTSANKTETFKGN